MAAWAANQVLRSQPADARELLAAGDALTGADRSTLRESIERHRAVLGRLMGAAQGLLDENGRSLNAQMLERVHQTLNAVSLDPGLREEGRAARLTREQTYTGLGLGPAVSQPEEEPLGGGEDDAEAEAEARREQQGARLRHDAQVRAARKRVAAAAEAVERARAQLADLEAAERRARDELSELER